MTKLIVVLSSVLFVSFAAQAGSPADITPNYFLYKQTRYVQTSSSAPTQLSGSNAFALGCYIEARAVGSILSGSMTAPGGSASPLQIGDMTDGNGDFGADQKFSGESAMNAAYTSGIFIIAGETADSSYSAGLRLTGTFSKFTEPALTTFSNASWSGGSLQVSNSTAATINWNSTQGAKDMIFLMIQDQDGKQVSRTLLPGTATGSTLPVLATGTYGLSMIYMAISGSDSTSIFGATGYAGYVKDTEVTIVSSTASTSGSGGGGGNGTFYTDFTGVVPLWDFSGSYSGDFGGGINLTFTITQDPTGKFSGNGTLASDDSEGTVMSGSISVTGAVKGTNTAPVLSFSVLGAGSGTVNSNGNIDAMNFTGKIKFTCDVSGTNLVVTGGSASAKGTDLVTKKKISMSQKFGSPFSLISLPNNVTGDWTLTQALIHVGSKILGSGTAQMSTGTLVEFPVTGSKSSTTKPSKLTLKNKAGSLSLGVNVTDSGMDIMTLKGKLFGQSLNYTAP